MATVKPILISGAGLASLLLAQSLRRSSIPFHIFERDSSLSSRAQGYRLRLSSAGLDAIEEALGPEGFKTFWAACGQTAGSGFSSMNAITNEVLSSMPANAAPPSSTDDDGKPKEVLGSRNGKIVGISRGDMRKIFMAGCEPYIQWSHHVTGYELTGSGGVRAVFADGTKSVEGALLVGGEGIYSKVAKQLSGGALKVYDTGARGIHGQAPTTAFKLLGEGVWRFADATRDNGRVFAITNVRSGDMDDPDTLFGWTMVAQPGVIQIPGDDLSIVGAPAADLARKLTAGWHPRFKPLFDDMIDHDAAFWKITCSTPTGVPEWPNEPRVTVIGDAAHSMTPAGGIGANTAVQDSALLGRLLADGYKEDVTAAYEKEMRVYASTAVQTSYGLAEKEMGVKIDVNTSKVV